MPLLLALAFLAVATPIVHGGGARPYQPTWGSVTTHPNPAWFEGVKFGLYAHFGPYSVPAKFSEWYSHNMYDNGSAVHAYHVKTYGEGFGYKDFIANFTAPRFNATEWAAIYKRSGARYAGPVAEHADGFAMFKSNVSHYNAFEMGPKRDVVDELRVALRAEGLKFITTLHHQWLYAWYPTWDNYTDCGDAEYQLTPEHGGLYGPRVSGPSEWHTPHASQAFMDYFLAKATEVVDQYRPDLVYFDSKWATIIDDAHRLDFLAHYYNSAAAWGTEVVTTYKNTDLEKGAGILDFERGGVGNITFPKWQTDDAMDRNSWSWVNPPSLKNASELIGELADIVSKNGNLLLDLPPHADGSIDPVVVRTLEDMGDWLSLSGIAIFNTVPWKTYGEGPTRISPGSFHEWPTFTAKDFRFTTNGKCVFALAMAWSDDGYTITSLATGASLGGVGSTITKVSLVGYNGTVKWAQEADGLHIAPLAGGRPAALDHVFAFQVTLDNATVGALDWHPIRPLERGAQALLRWSSAATAERDAQFVLEYSTHRDGEAPVWEHIADVAGAHELSWTVPDMPATVAAVAIRVRAVAEPLSLETVVGLLA